MAITGWALARQMASEVLAGDLASARALADLLVNYPGLLQEGAEGQSEMVLVYVDGHLTVQLTDPDDDTKRAYQYRRRGDGIEKRVLREDGSPYYGSSWELMGEGELAWMRSVRGCFHPILDPLGL